MTRRQLRQLGWISIAAACVLASPAARADVRLPHVFGSHMVLQRDKPLPVWGWAEPGEEVAVQIAGQPPVATKATAAGEWRVTLPAMPAGGPFTVTIKGKNAIVLEDVLVGEVWIGSGQSNMQFSVASSINGPEETAAAKWPRIRLFDVPRRPSGFPQNDVNATWRACSPETVPRFSAALYFFGRDLYKELDVPMGLIHSSWGGTRIEPWTPPAGFAAVPELKGIYEQVLLTDPHSPSHKERLGKFIADTEAWLKTAREALAQEAVLAPAPAYPKELNPFTSHQSPCTLYNGMIHGLVPFAFRGAIWYQGESNHRDGKLYTQKMKALILGWRQVWQDDAMPFYYVQIAPFYYGNENAFILPEFWEAQAAVLDEVPNTGMIVTNDIGNVRNIHPKNKQEVGRRLALIALAKTYGRTGLVYSGPTFKEMKIEGDKVRILFDHVGGGLASRDSKPLTWFEIIGQETDFVKAAAQIDGGTVVLSAPGVKQPAAVRFAWHRNAVPNLMNKEGLPARPFRAGQVPKRDFLKLRIKEAEDYQLVYDLNLANLGKTVKYDADNRARVNGPIDRIAYFLELRKAGGPTEYVYVSMDAFTQDLGKIGVPTLESKAKFQLKVANMNVESNVKGIQTGSGLKGGNIEFWPNNYGPANAAGIPNASSALWDFGDQISGPADGHGCMQVHNYAAKQTIFAINNWKAGPNAAIGIGTSTGRTRDWTFARNAGQYQVKRLRVLVHVKK